MPDVDKVDKQKRTEKKQAVAADGYNPVNMAGNAIEKCGGLSHKKPPNQDDYNPVNMAGKTTEACNDVELTKSKRDQKSD